MISTQDLQDWMKADDADAPMLRILEEAAVKAAERITGRYLGVTATRTETIRFKNWPLALQNDPIGGVVTSVSQWDGSAYGAVDASSYYVDGSLIYSNASFIPSIVETGRRFQVVYQAGYTVDALDADVWAAPSDIRMAVMLTVGHWFENREAVIVGTNAIEIPFSARVLLDNWTRVVV